MRRLLVIMLVMAVVTGAEHWTAKKRRERQAAADAEYNTAQATTFSTTATPAKEPSQDRSDPRRAPTGDGDASHAQASSEPESGAVEKPTKAAKKPKEKRLSKSKILKKKTQREKKQSAALGAGLEPVRRGPPYNCGRPCKTACDLGYHLDVDGCPDNCACLTRADVEVGFVPFVPARGVCCTVAAHCFCSMRQEGTGT